MAERYQSYFVMKSDNHQNLAIAFSRNIWSTQPHNEKKLNDAFLAGEVILIFSVNKSGAFQGVARMTSVADPNKTTADPWINDGDDPENHTQKYGGIFGIQWICQREMPFSKTNHLVNPYNENKPVRISRDGQEIQPAVGAQLVRLIEEFGIKYSVKDFLEIYGIQVPEGYTESNDLSNNTSNNNSNPNTSGPSSPVSNSTFPNPNPADVAPEAKPKVKLVAINKKPSMYEPVPPNYSYMPPPRGERTRYEIRAGDWNCPLCTHLNFMKRIDCRKCGYIRKKSDEIIGYNEPVYINKRDRYYERGGHRGGYGPGMDQGHGDEPDDEVLFFGNNNQQNQPIDKGPPMSSGSKPYREYSHYRPPPQHPHYQQPPYSNQSSYHQSSHQQGYQQSHQQPPYQSYNNNQSYQQSYNQSYQQPPYNNNSSYNQPYNQSYNHPSSNQYGGPHRPPPQPLPPHQQPSPQPLLPHQLPPQNYDNMLTNKFSNMRIDDTPSSRRPPQVMDRPPNYDTNGRERSPGRARDDEKRDRDYRARDRDTKYQERARKRDDRRAYSSESESDSEDERRRGKPSRRHESRRHRNHSDSDSDSYEYRHSRAKKESRETGRSDRDRERDRTREKREGRERPRRRYESDSESYDSIEEEKNRNRREKQSSTKSSKKIIPEEKESAVVKKKSSNLANEGSDSDDSLSFESQAEKRRLKKMLEEKEQEILKLKSRLANPFGSLLGIEDNMNNFGEAPPGLRDAADTSLPASTEIESLLSHWV